MRTLNVENLNKIKKAVPIIENKTRAKISFLKPQGKIGVKGNELNEFLVTKVLEAVDFGFDVDDALLLTRENFVLEFVDIKEHTRRKNLKDVRARVIGSNGKAKKTIQELTGCIIVINENKVGIISDVEHADAVVQSIILLIQGTKHGNVFAYLEKQNINLRNFDSEDLGLKEGIRKIGDDS